MSLKKWTEVDQYFSNFLAPEAEVVDAESDDPRIHGVWQLNELLRDSNQVDSTTVQTVGIKGYDGFTVSLVVD